MDLDAMAKAMGPMQQAMQKAESERASALFEGSAGGGAVKIRITGNLEVRKVAITPAAAQGGDVEMLEDLVAAAVNDALRQHRNKFGTNPQDQVTKLMAGADLSSLMGPLMAAMGRQ
jgi:DNA-binding YbaB/EbfC family protein